VHDGGLNRARPPLGAAVQKRANAPGSRMQTRQPRTQHKQVGRDCAAMNPGRLRRWPRFIVGRTNQSRVGHLQCGSGVSRDLLHRQRRQPAGKEVLGQELAALLLLIDEHAVV